MPKTEVNMFGSIMKLDDPAMRKLGVSWIILGKPQAPAEHELFVVVEPELWAQLSADSDVPEQLLRVYAEVDAALSPLTAQVGSQLRFRFNEALATARLWRRQGCPPAAGFYAELAEERRSGDWLNTLFQSTRWWTPGYDMQMLTVIPHLDVDQISDDELGLAVRMTRIGPHTVMDDDIGPAIATIRKVMAVPRFLLELTR